MLGLILRAWLLAFTLTIGATLVVLAGGIARLTRHRAA